MKLNLRVFRENKAIIEKIKKRGNKQYSSIQFDFEKELAYLINDDGIFIRINIDVEKKEGELLFPFLIEYEMIKPLLRYEDVEINLIKDKSTMSCNLETEKEKLQLPIKGFEYVIPFDIDLNNFKENIYNEEEKKVIIEASNFMSSDIYANVFVLGNRVYSADKYILFEKKISENKDIIFNSIAIPIFKLADDFIVYDGDNATILKRQGCIVNIPKNKKTQYLLTEDQWDNWEANNTGKYSAKFSKQEIIEIVDFFKPYCENIWRKRAYIEFHENSVAKFIIEDQMKITKNIQCEFDSELLGKKIPFSNDYLSLGMSFLVGDQVVFRLDEECSVIKILSDDESIRYIVKPINREND